MWLPEPGWGLRCRPRRSPAGGALRLLARAVVSALMVRRLALVDCGLSSAFLDACHGADALHPGLDLVLLAEPSDWGPTAAEAAGPVPVVGLAPRDSLASEDWARVLLCAVRLFSSRIRLALSSNLSHFLV